jgi:drug/metabolite transporter (DMT)-like permease
MRRTTWIAFAALCILSGTSWAIPTAMTESLPPLEQQGLLFGLIGLAALLFSGRAIWSGSLRTSIAKLAGASIAFFGVPEVVVAVTQGSVPAISRSALYSMVPVIVVMAVAAGEDERGARRFLLPALVGLGGLLLLLPLGFSGSARGWLMLTLVCAAVVLVGLASVRLYRLAPGITFATAVAVTGLANAVFLLAYSAVSEDVVGRWSGLTSIVSLSSLVDVAEVLLIVWLLRDMLPIRFAARYLLIPLVTVLEGYLLVRPQVTARMGFGTVLLAAGAGMLLFLKLGEDETTLSLQ